MSHWIQNESTGLFVEITDGRDTWMDLFHNFIIGILRGWLAASVADFSKKCLTQKAKSR